MTELIWNEGMSVGIDAIDEDHKQIIAILAKLTSAHSEQISKQVIENIFSELEQYVSLHFVREESLLEKACYKNIAAHKESHQKFIEQLPKLKQQWLIEDNLACSERITTFLHKWIVEHILVEDLDYVPTLFNSSNTTINQLSNRGGESDNNSFFVKLSSTLSQKITLSKRVFITTFIPVIVVLLLSLVFLLDNYQRYKNISLVLGLNDVIMQVNEISHSLQAERGLSSGVVSSNYQRFVEPLALRRLITDKAIAKFLLLINQDIAPSVKKNIRYYSEHVRSDFKSLAAHRQQLDKKLINFTQTYQAYTVLIEQLLSVPENLIHVDMNSQLANDISAINSVLLFKEYMGQIRAIGMNIISANNDDIYSNFQVSLLVGKQLNALRVFHYSANEQQKTLCAKICNEENHVQKLKQLFSQVIKKYEPDQRGPHWFRLMSIEIDELKALTNSLTTSFNDAVLAENQRLENNYLGTLAVLSIFLFAALLFSSILNYSIISPVRRLTRALNSMAKGHRDIQFRNVVNNDEIGAMQLAYEKLRRRLLQVDIFQAIVNSQKKEIEYRKLQQEHFKTLAFTDALTGAVNRHQFNKVLAEEISRANYEHQPLSILLLDIDYFKKINDNFGHGIGDEVLIMFYRACKEVARVGDVVARIGGEEFVIILPETNALSAYQFAERLRKKIQLLDIVVDDITVKLTVSIGVSQWFNDLFSCAEDFVADADKSLYQAKAQGRNRVNGRSL